MLDYKYQILPAGLIRGYTVSPVDDVNTPELLEFDFGPILVLHAEVE